MICLNTGRSSVEIWITISGSWCYKGFVNLFDIPSAWTSVATARHTTKQQWRTFCGLPVVYPEIAKKTTKSSCFLLFRRFSCHKNRGEILGWASLPCGFSQAGHPKPQELVAPKLSKHGQEETMNSEARKANNWWWWWWCFTREILRKSQVYCWTIGPLHDRRWQCLHAEWRYASTGAEWRLGWNGSGVTLSARIMVQWNNNHFP